MEPNLNKRIHVFVRQEHVDEGACGDPNHCMIKIAVAQAVGIANLYIRVDARGVGITRRKDYRERAFMPLIAYKKMLAFDRDATVEPFDFWLTFHKTSAVAPTSDERRAQINGNREKRKAEGRPDKRYGLAKRLKGVAFTAEAAKELGVSPS